MNCLHAFPNLDGTYNIQYFGYYCPEVLKDFLKRIHLTSLNEIIKVIEPYQMPSDIDYGWVIMQ
jgi:hypothetical protein